MPDYAIILAGGKGQRLGGSIPKQFLPILGKPMLIHSIHAFLKAIPNISIIVIVPESNIEFWEEISVAHQLEGDIKIAFGGEERFHSVKNGLDLVPDDANGIVGVHDAARALIDVDTIKRCYEHARSQGSAIPVVPMKDSIRYGNRNDNKAVPRDQYQLVQTPQCFDINMLKQAYLANYQSSFTDDASVYEAIGEKVHLVEGHEENIKLTWPRDMIMAEIILKSRLKG